MVTVGSRQPHSSATEFMIDVVFESEDADPDMQDLQAQHDEKDSSSDEDANFTLHDIRDEDLGHAVDPNAVQDADPGDLEERALIEDPFFVVDLGLVARKYAQWMRLFPRVTPHYAIKCNPDAGVTKTLGFLGAGFDAASKAEIMIAFAAGM